MPAGDKTFDPDKAAAILAMISAGVSVRSSCAANEVKAPTFLDWVGADLDDLAERYARARIMQGEVHAGEIIEIADIKPEQIVTTRPDGTTEAKADPAHVAWLKNRVDARKWVAARLHPKQYGDKLDVQANVTVDLGAKLAAARARAISGK